MTEREDPRRIADRIAVEVLSRRPKPVGNVVPLFGAKGAQAQRAAAVPLETEVAIDDWESWWLPPVVQRWVDAQAAACNVPKAIPIAAAVCAIATVLQGKVEVEVRPGWREPVSVYWLIAAPTGSMKSRVLEAAKRPIKALEEQRRRDAEDQAKQNRKTRALYEGRAKKLRAKFAAKGSLSDADRYDLDLAESALETLPNDKPAVWCFSNINPALLPRKMHANLDAEGYARVAVLADEDTFLRNVMGRHSGHADLEAVLQGYTGGAIEMTRKSVATDDTVDVRVSQAHLTCLILTQPHVLDWARQQSVLADQGFWGRCVVTSVDRAALPSLEAPQVPDSVQTDWERLIATLDALPGSQLVRVPQALWEPGGALQELHVDVSAQVTAGNGGEGFAVRTVGRVCRFWALAHIVDNVELSTTGQGGRARHEGIDFKYLSLSLYYHVVSLSRALQPPASPLDRVTLRALRWLRQYPGSTISSEVPIRAAMRSLRLGKDIVEQAFDSLVEHGYLEQAKTVRNRHGRATVTYRVITLYAEGEQAPNAPITPIRSWPVADEPEPTEADEGPPSAEEYLSGEEYDQ